MWSKLINGVSLTLCVLDGLLALREDSEGRGAPKLKTPRINSFSVKWRFVPDARA